MKKILLGFIATASLLTGCGAGSNDSSAKLDKARQRIAELEAEVSTSTAASTDGGALETTAETGVFLSLSQDATGQGRNQVIDLNWIVVGQTPSVGAPIDEGDAVLSAVKIGEPNDC